MGCCKVGGGGRGVGLGGGPVQKPGPCAAAVWASLNSLSQGAGAVKR